MQSHELEDLTLLLIRDADEAEMWIDRWALGYPTVRTVSVGRGGPVAAWQQAVGAAFAGIPSRNIAVVAHGAGVSGWLAWLYLADVGAQRRIRNMLLVAPLQSAFPDDAVHTLQRVRCHCPAALVVGRNDGECPHEWARLQAQTWGARLFAAPQAGRLNGHLNGWPWGMKLLQEMLLQ